MSESHLPDPVGIGATTWPKATALATSDGRSLTYQELDETVGVTAGWLNNHETNPGSAIGVAVTDRLSAVVVILSVIRAGGIATPIDPTSEPETIEYRMQQGDIEVLITDVDGLEDETDMPVFSPYQVREGTVIEPSPIPKTQPITQLFTSGSTGEPKPVIHTIRNHTAAGRAAVDRLALDTGERWYDPLGFHHMGGFAPILRSLPEGTSVILSAEPAPDGYLAEIAASEATIASIVPTMLYRALETETAAPETLRCLLVGGAPLRESLYQRARNAAFPVWATYGLTETIGQVTTATPAERDAHPGTVGRPLSNIGVRILDADGAPVDADTVGRIEVTGPTVSETVATTHSDRGWRLVTEDVGKLDEAGRLWIVGRHDDAIHTGGETVHPLAVEERLATHPSVDDVVVVGLPDPEWGERVVAAIVPTRSIEEDELREWSTEQLDAHAVPKTFVEVDAIPRTVSGTVDRQAVRATLTQAED